MALEGQPRVLGRHARAVVRDLEPGDPAAFHVHRDAPGAGVERVLHELLDRGRRALDDLARGDLVDEGVRKKMDSSHGPKVHESRPCWKAGAGDA